MNLPIIVNRDGSIGSDGWVHIVPKGVLPNKESGVAQVLDDQALDSIMGAFKEDAQRLGNRWPGLYLGEEHFIYDPKKSSEAFGWAKEFDKREDGIWAKPEWTDLGSAAIRNKRFKYTSFVVDPPDVEPLGTKSIGGLPHYRILKLHTVGLTNLPNGKHLLSPITNKEFRRGSEAEAGNNNENKKQTMKTIANKLGLSADASEESVLAELSKVMNRATALEQQVTPLTNRVAELTTANATLLDEQVDGLLAEHGVKDANLVNRLKPVLAPLKNREERVTAIKELQEGFGGGKPGARTQESGARGLRILNRADGKTPGSVESSADDDKARSEKILNRANELKGASPTRSFDDCWNAAQREAAAAA